MEYKTVHLTELVNVLSLCSLNYFNPCITDFQMHDSVTDAIFCLVPHNLEVIKQTNTPMLYCLQTLSVSDYLAVKLYI